MKLKELLKNIEGDFYLVLPNKGAIRGIKREPKKFSKATIAQIPQDCLEREAIVRPWDWLTLLVEVRP